MVQGSPHSKVVPVASTASMALTNVKDRGKTAAVGDPRSGWRNYSNVDVTTRFGDRLRQLRKSRNMTQLQMSIQFGIDRSYISNVEQGRKSISLPTLEVIALGFNMSLSDLLWEI